MLPIHQYTDLVSYVQSTFECLHLMQFFKLPVVIQMIRTLLFFIWSTSLVSKWSRHLSASPGMHLICILQNTSGNWTFFIKCLLAVWELDFFKCPRTIFAECSIFNTYSYSHKIHTTSPFARKQYDDYCQWRNHINSLMNNGLPFATIRCEQCEQWHHKWTKCIYCAFYWRLL